MLTPAAFQVHFSSRFSVHVKGKGTLRANTHRSTHRRLRQSWGWRGAISRLSNTLLSSLVVAPCPSPSAVNDRCPQGHGSRKLAITPKTPPTWPTSRTTSPPKPRVSKRSTLTLLPPKEWWVWVEQGNPAPVSGATNGTGRLSERAPRPEQDQGPRVG